MIKISVGSNLFLVQWQRLEGDESHLLFNETDDRGGLPIEPEIWDDGLVSSNPEDIWLLSVSHLWEDMNEFAPETGGDGAKFIVGGSCGLPLLAEEDGPFFVVRLLLCDKGGRRWIGVGQ